MSEEQDLKLLAEAIRESINSLEVQLNSIELKRKELKEHEFHFLQPVLVRDDPQDEWQKAFFFRKTMPPFAYETVSDGGIDENNECIPDPEATTHINWIPYHHHDLILSDDLPGKNTFWKLKDGKVITPENQHLVSLYDVTDYAIIKE